MSRTVITAALLLAASISVKTYAVPEKRIPTEIVRHGNDLWFVAWTVDRVEKDALGMPKLHAFLGRLTTRGRFRITPAGPEHMPAFATHTPDGALWFTDAGRPVLWRIGKDGRITKVAASTAAQHVVYAAGDLWCSHPYSGSISRLGLDGSGKGGFSVPDELPPPMTSLPPPPPGPRVASLAVGSDGAIWFPEPYRKRIGRLTAAGEMTFYPVPHALMPYSVIVAGPDGALWYTTDENRLGRITTTGEISSVPIGFPAMRLTADSRGRVWYAHGSNSAGVIHRDGTRQELEVPKLRSIRSIVEGPDGAMWIADETQALIARIELADARVAPRIR